MKKILPYVIMLLMISAFSLAAEEDNSVSVDVEPIKQTISKSENAVYEFTIYNNGTKDNFKVYYPGVSWGIDSHEFELGNEAAKIFQLEAKPLYVNSGQKAIPIVVKSDSKGVIERVNLIANVESGTKENYKPSVRGNLFMPEEVLPGEDINIRMEVINRNPLSLENVSVTAESEGLSETKSISLDPTTKNVTSSENVNFKFSTEEYASPKDMIFEFSISFNDEKIFQKESKVTVKKHSPEFEKSVEETGALFKQTKTITIENVGNVVKEGSHRIKAPIFKKMFSSTSPEAAVLKKEGERFFVWDFSLEPGEETTIELTKNYRGFVLAIVVIIIGIGVYIFLRSPLKIQKDAEMIEEKDEEGISKLKVTLKIKNVSEKSLSGVELYDRVPSLVDYIKEEIMGSLPPSKVMKHEEKGTMLKWEIPTIEGLEERLITYKIQTQMKVLGGISLPQCNARFKTKSGNKRVVKSNVVNLSEKKKQENQ